MSKYERLGANAHVLGGRLAPYFSSGQWIAWLVLAASLFLSVLAWHFEQNYAREIQEAEFKADAKDVEFHLRQQMLAYEQMLKGAAGLFGATPSVGREEWHAYVNRLDIQKSYPGILDVGYSMRLFPDEKENHIQQVRDEGLPGYTVFPEGARDEYTPTIYLEPPAGRNLRAFGYDMLADPVRRTSMERARDTGVTSISGKLALFPNASDNSQVGVLLYHPVYRNGWPADTTEHRRVALQGYVHSSVDMHELMAWILVHTHPNLEIEIYDSGAKIAPETVLYDSKPGHHKSPRFSSRTLLDVGGRQWVLAVSSQPYAAGGLASYQTWTVLAFGVALSLLLFTVFRKMASNRNRALALAARISADHVESVKESAEFYRQLFDKAAVAIALADAETGEIIDINGAMERLTGWDRSELIGKSQKMLHRPESVPSSALNGVFSRHASGTERELSDAQIVTKNGEMREVEIKVSPLNQNGLSLLICFYRDITESKQYKQSLFSSNELLERIFANIRTSIAYMDADFNFIRVNQAYATTDGHSPDYYVGKNHFELFPNQENEKIFREVVASGVPYVAYAKPFVYEHNQERGVTYWDWEAQPIKDNHGLVTGLILSLVDRTDEKRAEETQRIYGRVLDASINSIAIVDATKPDMPLIYVNPAFTKVTGFTEEEALGRNPRFLRGADWEQPEIENIRGAIREKRDGQAVLRNYRKDGSLFWSELYVSPVWGDGGEVTHFIGVARDISERKGYEAELERMANFDTLTGLPNRNLFHDRLSQAIAHTNRSSGIMAVAMLDLDGFKLVNEGLGHHAGDLLLQEVAHRLSHCVREEDTVARLGGDEFVVVLPSLAKAEDAVIVAEKLLQAFSASIRCDMQDMYVTASIGIAVYPKDGADAESLLRYADLAMYRAKEKGRNRYQFYASEMDRNMAQCMEISNDLHRALERNEFTLHYQPQVDLRSGHIKGVEALLRWRHPKSGWIPPDKFIPIAEESGLIIPIGNWVLQQACLAAKAWHEQGFNISIGVNLSARQIREAGFVNSVKDALLASGLEARYVELELTESILIEQAQFVSDVLHQLREMGVQFSLDDFGTGYSSLSYLKRFPISRLKIDRSFIRDIVTDPEDAAIVGAIISMAHNLKLNVIAEGVETMEQLAFLRSRYCDEMQGYYFSKPVPEADIALMLQQGKKIELSGFVDGQAPAILLVDDEKNILSSLVRLLRRDGYRILQTTSAQEALGMLACNEVAVIVSDHRMAEMNGVEFLRRAKLLHPDSMRMALSGYSDLQSVTDAINEGAVYKFITKPWEDEQLRNLIREAFESYGMKKQHDSLTMQLAAANEDLLRARQMMEPQVDEKAPLL